MYTLIYTLPSHTSCHSLKTQLIERLCQYWAQDIDKRCLFNLRIRLISAADSIEGELLSIEQQQILAHKLRNNGNGQTIDKCLLFRSSLTLRLASTKLNDVHPGGDGCLKASGEGVSVTFRLGCHTMGC